MWFNAHSVDVSYQVVPQNTKELCLEQGLTKR
jgi:hypothetical protein